MKKKSLSFILPLVVYPFDIMFAFGETDEQVVKMLKNRGINTEERSEWKFENTVKGRCIMFPDNQVLIRLLEFPKTSQHYGFLQHEIFHAIDFILRRIGMDLTPSSGEAYAYLTGYITEVVYKTINTNV